jgi:hypothetical protein
VDWDGVEGTGEGVWRFGKDCGIFRDLKLSWRLDKGYGGEGGGTNVAFFGVLTVV